MSPADELPLQHAQPPVQIHVSPVDNSWFSGDRLAAAVDAAPAGAQIFIAAGIYRLKRPLTLSRSVTLHGAGHAVTVISSIGGPAVLQFSGEGNCALLELTFTYAGSTAADVVTVAGGHVDIRACRFSGAVRKQAAFGNGLTLLGEARGSVHDCEATENEHAGIWVGAQAQPLLTGNRCFANGRCGIGFSAEAGGTAVSNDCHRNAKAGIQLLGKAQPTLLRNCCTHNGTFGLAYEGEAAGTARGNNCTFNGKNGIHLTVRVQPALEQNVCAHNISSGIHCSGKSRAGLRGNFCAHNQVHGIYVGDGAQPLLEHNLCLHNRWHGIAYLKRAGGTARRNLCRSNRRYGVYAVPGTTAELDDNRCQANTAGDLFILRRLPLAYTDVAPLEDG